MRCRSLLTGLLLGAIASCAYATVTITSGDPDRFTDASDRNTDPHDVVASLKRHLEALGQRYLAPDSSLTIRFLDIDRAGRPFRDLPMELRIVNGKADQPCIELEWALGAPATAAPMHRERVCDSEFLRPVGPGYSEHDPLVYEKRMLEEWFRMRFAATRPTASSSRLKPGEN